MRVRQASWIQGDATAYCSASMTRRVGDVQRCSTTRERLIFHSRKNELAKTAEPKRLNASNHGFTSTSSTVVSSSSFNRSLATSRVNAANDFSGAGAADSWLAAELASGLLFCFAE